MEAWGGESLVQVLCFRPSDELFSVECSSEILFSVECCEILFCSIELWDIVSSITYHDNCSTSYFYDIAILWCGWYSCIVMVYVQGYKIALTRISREFVLGTCRFHENVASSFCVVVHTVSQTNCKNMERVELNKYSNITECWWNYITFTLINSVNNNVSLSLCPSVIREVVWLTSLFRWPSSWYWSRVSTTCLSLLGRKYLSACTALGPVQVVFTDSQAIVSVVQGIQYDDTRFL